MNSRPPPPAPPVEPEPWQCCGSGCEPCIYDRYWDDLARYELALADWQRANEAPGEPGTPVGTPGPAVDKGGVSP